MKSRLKGHLLNKEVKESPELSTMLGTVTSISVVPSYLMKKGAMKTHNVQIHRPYYMTKKDIKAQFKACLL